MSSQDELITPEEEAAMRGMVNILQEVCEGPGDATVVTFKVMIILQLI